jgi:hypothetical protein
MLVMLWGRKSRLEKGASTAFASHLTSHHWQLRLQQLLPNHFHGSNPPVVGTNAACSAGMEDCRPAPSVLETGADVEEASQPENRVTPTTASQPGVSPLSCKSITQSDEADTLVLSLPFPDQPAPTYSSAQVRSVADGCQICLSPFASGQSLSWSPHPACCHVFHRSCIQAWLLTVSMDCSGHGGEATCPCCRLPFLGFDCYG